MVARIYKPARNTMQSGRARSQHWVLEFEPETARGIEPLMGWTSSGDTRQQLRLNFDTKEHAIAYAVLMYLAILLHRRIVMFGMRQQVLERFELRADLTFPDLRRTAAARPLREPLLVTVLTAPAGDPAGRETADRRVPVRPPCPVDTLDHRCQLLVGDTCGLALLQRVAVEDVEPGRELLERQGGLPEALPVLGGRDHDPAAA